MKSAVCRTLLSGLAVILLIPIHAADKQELTVKIIDRQDHESHYTYVVPGYFTATSDTDVTGTTRTTGEDVPAHAGSFDVRGATLSLHLPDGRVAVVNCDIKFAERFAGRAGNHRDCRVPLINELQVEFSGGNAKLKWPVSIDGKKIESETYKILGILEKPSPTR